MVFLGLLNGGLFFLADLLRNIPDPVEVECWRLKSYLGETVHSSGKVNGFEHASGHFKGNHVVVVDDILDSGLTLSEVRAHLLNIGAQSVKTCVLLDKKRASSQPVKADWVGFEIANQFVVGYGMDYNGYHRNLPDIHLFVPETAKTEHKF